MSDAPPPPPRRRPGKPNRTLAKVLFFCVFLALFGTADVIAYRYEMAARAVWEQAPNNRQTWELVAARYPLSYISCRARAQLAASEAGVTGEPVDDPALAGYLRAGMRKGLVPALRWIDGKVTQADLAATADRAEQATFDPRRVGYFGLLATLVGLLLALYQLLGFWREYKLPLGGRLGLVAVGGALLFVHWARAIGPLPELLSGFVGWSHAFEAEFLSGAFYALLAFCALFYTPRPGRKRIVRTDEQVGR